ncbi:MAG: hypothetical protein DRO40_08930 [Thermoprotei archaeon]|nr:MAG: hypothetical protein DRO40_08930 [Thermoprotei archaeon]
MFRDKVFWLLFIFALLGMASLVLSEYYSVEALMLFSLTIAGIVVVKHRSPKRKELTYLLLMSIPIGMKLCFYYYSASVIDAILSSLVAIYDIINVIGLSVLVALGEESFRAVIYELVKAIEGDVENEFIDKSALLVSNISWIILHFIRRKEYIALYPSLTAYYVIWLFVTGIVFTIIYKKAGLGYAALMHFLINSF